MINISRRSSTPAFIVEGRTTYLHLNIQNANPTLLSHIFHSLHTRAIEVAAKLCMFDETTIIYQLQERVSICEVVLSAMLFAVSRCTSGMRDREAEAIGILLEQALKESRLSGA